MTVVGDDEQIVDGIHRETTRVGQLRGIPLQDPQRLLSPDGCLAIHHDGRW